MNYPFKNQNLNNEISESGYVILPFFNSVEVEQLLSFYKKNHSSSVPGFYASSHSTDIQFRKLMSDEIKKSILSSTQVYFENVAFLGGSFIVKTNKQVDRLNPHQDWSIVDETTSDSFNIWIPLVDVNKDNGAIKVAPKSHLWFTNHRGPNIPDPLSNRIEVLWESMIDLPMKAGQALIYNHKLYHGSTPNRTKSDRIAAVFGLKHVEDPMRYYYGNNEVVEVYESNANFFLSGNIQHGNQELKLVAKSTIQSLPSPNLPLEYRKQANTDSTVKKLLSSFLKKFQLK